MNDTFFVTHPNDIDTVRTIVNSVTGFGDSWFDHITDYQHKKQQQQEEEELRGHVYWSRTIVHLPRFALLTLREEFYDTIDNDDVDDSDDDAYRNRIHQRIHRRLLNAKYDVLSSSHNKNGYYGGDLRSWQRYTAKPPLPVVVTQCDEREGVFSFKPCHALKKNTWYAIVLLHTHHKHPVACLYDDYIVPFKTEK